MHVVITEKPSVARDIAAVLGAPQRHDGYLIVGSDWIITWAFGHLVTLADPQSYDPAWRTWSFATLPMLPSAFHLVPIPKSSAQLKIVKSLLNRKDVTDIVAATDADREGEHIFRTIYQFVGCTKPVQRLWLSETTPAAIRTALGALQPGSTYDSLGQAAEVRSQADWLVGLNATRAFTLRHGIPGQGALSVGRVQTPTLRLIADRDRAIAAFQPVPYWQVVLTFAAPEGTWVGVWNGVDGEHPDRIPTEARARHISAKVLPGTPGHILSVEKKRVVIHPPLPFSLNDLQKAANRRFGLTAQQTLDAAQSLYERHVTSYPRTDAKYLTTDVAATLPERLQGLARTSFGELVQAIPAPLNASRLVNDAKVAKAGHYAIIPTGQTPSGLSDRDRWVYDLITRQFLASLMPAGKDERTTVWTQAGGERFKTTGTTVLEPGWRQALRPVAELDEAKDDEPLGAIPAGLRDGEAVMVQHSEIQAKETKAPPKLTDASLLALMEQHGLGTPATRARIVEVLLARGFVERTKKALESTEKGQKLLTVVPETIQSPELTGQWEARLEAIAVGDGAPQVFLQAIRQYTQELVEAAKNQSAKIIGTDWGPCPRCRIGWILSGKKGWGCSRWREGCRFVIWKTIAGKRLTEPQVKTLLAGKMTRILQGFQSKAGKPFSARLKLSDETGQVEFIFDAGREGPKRHAVRKKPQEIAASGHVGTVASRYNQSHNGGKTKA